MIKISVRTLFSLIAVCCFFAGASHAASIEFDVGDFLSSRDFAEAMKTKNRITALDPDRHKALQAKNLVQELPLTLPSNDTFNLMLVCGDISESGAMQNVQLLLVDDRKDTPRVVQRFKLGNGEEPEIFLSGDPDEAQDMMVRIIRGGNNTEGYVYDINKASGKLTETFRINRGTPERRKIDVKAVMQSGGMLEVSSRALAYQDVLDLSGALNALIEDELYQENGRPIPALVNLKCIRAGWEEDWLYMRDGQTMLDLGLSLVTLSQKTVAEVTLTYRKQAADKWLPHAVSFQPFLPYR